MIKKPLLLALIFGSLSMPVFAAEVEIEQKVTIKQKDMQEMNNYVEEENEDIYESIEEQIDAYISKMKKRAKRSNSGKKTFISYLEPVALKPTHPDFVKSLSTAYDKAFFTAQQEFVMDVFGEIVSEKEKTLFSNTSTDAKVFDSDKETSKGTFAKIGRLFEKTLSLAEKKLDDALVGLGVDPADIANATVTEKQTLMRDAFVSETMEQATGRVAGFVPIKTFVGKDKEGQYFVGVVGMRSVKTEAVAQSIATKREPMMNGRGKAIEDIVPEDKQQLLNEMGVRLVFDETGRPALISYGQWGFNSRGLDSHMKSRAKNNAKKMALSKADAMVSDFVNGAMVVKSKKESGEIITQAVEREGGRNGMVSEQTLVNIVDKINEEAKLKSKLDKAGFETVKKWSAKNEHGHTVVGVVRKWTFEGLSSAQDIINNKVAKNRGYKRAEEESISMSAGVNESIEYDTVNDF